MKKILWHSEHQPIQIQVDELKKIFGEIEIIQPKIRPTNQRGYLSAEKIVEEFKLGGYDEIVMVAPLSVIEKVIELGVRPLKARVKQLPSPFGADFEWRGRYFKFLGIERVLRIEVVTELLK